MEKYIILADSTCDLSPEIREYFGLEDYISGYIHISDGRDLSTLLDWSNIDHDDFYSALSSKNIKITSAPASPEEYYEKFKAYAAEGYDIISIALSSYISTTHTNTVKAAERVMAEYPERRVYAFDTRRMSGAFGLLVIYAKEMQNEGKSFDEVVAWLEENKNKVHQMGPIDDLVFVARRGRISMGKAIMGSFAGVKPMGDCNSEGYVSVLTKAKGMKKAIALTTEYVKLCAKDIENNYVYITHSNRAAYGEMLRDKIENELHPKKVFLSDVYSASGTNIGPGMVCAYFLGDEISEDGDKEKEFMNQAVENCK